MITYKFHNSANRRLSDKSFQALRGDMEEVALECLGEVPNYQIFSDNQSQDVENMVVIAHDGKVPIGFVSSLIFHIGGRKILHLGLTCVKSQYRGRKVSQKLVAKLLTGYLLRNALFKKVWISNLACVLSSLGNVAKYFDEVYPSPRYQVCPSLQHYILVQEISKNFRAEMYIPESAKFDDDKNIFKNSVTGNIFEKSEGDLQFYHRESLYNIFYKKLINFNTGDEVLQIGTMSLWSVVSRTFLKAIKKLKIAWHNFKESEVQA